VQIGIRAHRSHVSSGGRGRRLFGSRFGVGAGRSRGSLRRPHATERAKIDQVLLHSTPQVERVDRSFDLSLGIEDRLLTGWGGEVNSEGRCVECSTRFLHIAAYRRQQVRSTLANARLGFIGAQPRALRRGALLSSESRRVTEREWKEGRLLCVERCRCERDHCGRCCHESAHADGEFSH